MRHILPLLSLAAFIACDEPASAPLPKSTPVVPVKVVPITQHTQAQPIRQSGIVAHKESITLSFKIGGIIQSINVDEGDHVQKGQIIAQLEQEEITARVNQAQSAKDKTQRDLKRVQKLYEDKVVTQEQLQNATTALEIASAELQIAHFNQKHARIQAPANGRILRRFAERNELITPGAPILHIASDEQQPVLRIGLTDRDIILINLGDTATVRFSPYPNQTFQGTVSEIAEQANPQTGTFEIELTLQEAHLLKSGFIGHATLFPSAQIAHYRIPIDAVVEANEYNATIYIPDGTIARRVTIHPNHIGDNHIIVHKTSDLQLTHVITEGAPYLRDQSPIIIQ